MRVLYYDVKQNADIEKLGVEFRASLNSLLEEADFVSLHVPLLDSTHHLINAESFTKMKPHAFLINTSRGPVVDEAALVTALLNGTIRGAALDVFEHEPALTPGLAEMENVILTPHTPSATEDARGARSRIAAENIAAFLGGETSSNVVGV